MYIYICLFPTWHEEALCHFPLETDPASNLMQFGMECEHAGCHVY